MKCIEIKEDLIELLDGEIHDSRQEKIESHLKICGSCQAELYSLQKIRKTIKETLPTVAPASADNRVLSAFHDHHAATQNAKPQEKIGWFVIPKFAFAAAFLLLALFSGFAFQLGKMSANNVAVSVSDITLEPNTIENADFSAEQPTNKESEQLVKTKIVEVPVIKERIITKIVYIYRPQIKPQKNPKDFSAQDTFAINNSINEKEFLTQTNLQNFKPVSEIKPIVTKKEKLK